MEETQGRKNNIIFYILLFLASGGVIAAGFFLYGLSVVAIIRLACFVVFGQILVIFTVSAGVYYNSLLGDNHDHTGRFYLAYVVMMLLCALLPAMPVSAWPVVVIFALLTMLSNIPAGIVSGCVCLVTASCLGDTVYFAYFVIYLLCGIMAALLLANVDSEFRIGLPIVIIEAVLLVSLTVISVTSGAAISLELFIYPLVNAAITLLLVLLILKIYSSKVLFVREDRYLSLNDTESTILMEMKNSSPEDYYKTIHVVYFCDRLAERLGMDPSLVKCAGLYHRVGVIGGERNWENTGMICTEQGLPEEVLDILHEFISDDTPMRHGETAVLYMADCVVSSVQYLFKKNKDMTLDITTLIEAIFKQRWEAGVFDSCDLSIRQYQLMKKVFKEEKLYYDFLR